MSSNLLWTKEKCFEEGRKYKTKSEFKNNNSSAYQSACINEWIKEMDWFVRPIVHNKIWTKEKCFEEGKKYKTKTDFRNNNLSAYSASHKMGWIKEMDWFVPKTSTNDPIINKYIVYAYTDEINKVCYIGLTKNLKARHYKHCSNCTHRKKSIVKIYFDSINTIIPFPKILKNELNSTEAQYYENYFITYYTNNNYKILNKAKTGINCGSLGSTKEIYTYEKCFEKASLYDNISDFKQSDKKYYIKSLRNNWLKDFTWLKTNKIKWTYEMCYNISLNYLSLKDFRENDKKAYWVSYRNNWLKDFTWLKRQSSWTKEKCFEEAKRYKTKYEYQKSSRSSYMASITNGWIKEMDWFIEIKKPNGFWNIKENVMNESKKYKTKSLFKKNASGAYHSALKNNWLNECNFIL